MSSRAPKLHRVLVWFAGDNGNSYLEMTLRANLFDLTTEERDLVGGVADLLRAFQVKHEAGNRSKREAEMLAAARTAGNAAGRKV